MLFNTRLFKIAATSALFAVTTVVSLACDEATPPKPNAAIGDSAGTNRPITASVAPPANATRGVAANNPGKNSGPAIDAPPVPPKDAQYTLFCQEFNGPAHVQQAAQYKSELLKTFGGMRAWYIVHQEDRSTLYYGYYRPGDDRATKADRDKILALTTRVGDPVFRTCMVVPIDAADPTAPPEWNLSNLRKDTADTKHYFSLQIAAYKDSPERKQAAVDMVRAWRAEGIEAYYFHGPTTSVLTVGCWPVEALGRQDRGHVETRNTDDTILIYNGPGMSPTNQRKFDNAAEKQGVNVMTPALDPVDPTLKEALKRFPQHYVNGEAEGVKTGATITPKHSFLVEIPPRDSSPIAADAVRNTTPPPSNEAMRAIEPAQPTYTPGSGRLRGVGH